MGIAQVYFNGEWIAESELRIAVDDIGFLLGATVTERLRTFRGQVFRLDEHLRRLRRSLEIIGLEADAICTQVASAVPEFARRNRRLVDEDDDLSIVAFTTPGIAGTRRPTVCVHGYPLRFQDFAAFYETGLPVVISDIRQVPNECWPSDLKCRSRMHFYLADRAAAAAQPGARAVLLDETGHIAEATTANVLAHVDGEGLVSPPREHILAGVSLGVVRELAGEIGLPFVTRPLAVDELRAAGEAMLASTSVCLLPVVQCDGQPVGDGRPGPVFHRLLGAWSKLVGVDIATQAKQFAARRKSNNVV